MENELRGQVERCLRDAREKLMESIKLRALEDKWRPVNLVNKSGIARFADDMSEIGIESIHSWVYGSIKLNVVFKVVIINLFFL